MYVLLNENMSKQQILSNNKDDYIKSIIYLFNDFFVVEGSRLELTAFLKRRDNRLVLPADLVRQPAELAVLATRLQT